jgi:hypothetical protein
MATLRIVDIPAVGTVIERIHGGWGWLHREDPFSVPLPAGRDGGPVGLATEADALASLLAYHFQLGVPAAPDRQGGDLA